MKYKGIKIKKRNDNRWYGRIKQNEKYKYIYGKTQIDCYKKIKQYIDKNKIEQKNNTNNTTYGKWLDKWKSLYKIGKVKENTIKSYDNIINQYLKPKLEKIDIKKITLEMLQLLINNIHEKKPRQSQKVYELIKDSFNKAYINKYIDEDVTINLIKPKHEKQITRILNINEQKQFIEICQQRNNIYSDYLLLLLYQGMRIGEGLTLYKKDIDFENKIITIEEKENEKLYVKTKQSNRKIPMFYKSYEILLKYKNNNKIFNFTRQPIDDELNRIKKIMNIKELTPKSLRHTFITRMNEKNIPEHILQKWVGHEIGSKMTKMVYTHNDNMVEQEIIKKIDTKFDTIL